MRPAGGKGPSTTFQSLTRRLNDLREKRNRASEKLRLTLPFNIIRAGGRDVASYVSTMGAPRLDYYFSAGLKSNEAEFMQ